MFSFGRLGAVRALKRCKACNLTCTSLGGGWGNPFERDPQLVAKEAKQGLVSNTSRYGVVLQPNGDVDEAATAALREEMAPAQKTLQAASLFNRGGTLPELAAACLAETGFPAPKPPSTRVLRGPIAQLPHILELHKRRAEEDLQLFGV
jgi:5-oxoprolinase (ATP-hydrolysing)